MEGACCGVHGEADGWGGRGWHGEGVALGGLESFGAVVLLPGNFLVQTKIWTRGEEGCEILWKCRKNKGKEQVTR